jgi:hypothetical protein
MATVVMHVRENANNVSSAWRKWDEMHLSVTGTSYIDHEYVPWVQLQARTDVRLTCTYVTDTNTRISAGISLLVDRQEELAAAEEIE